MVRADPPAPPQPGPGGPPRAVLHFAADWLPVSEVFVHDLLRHLPRPGVVVAANPLRNTDRFPFPHVGSFAAVERWLHPKALRPAAVTAVLAATAARHRCGLVHAHHGYRVEQLLGVVRRRRLPLVLSLHGHDVTGYLEQRPDAYRQVRGRAAAVVVPSRFLAGLAADAGFPAERIRVLPSGVDTGFFRPTPLPDGPPEVLFVGRFVAKKGIDTLAAAWPQVQAAVPDARLRLLGLGPLEALARSIPGAVHVELSPDRVAVRDAMRRCRLVVTPSHRAGDDAVESLLMVNVEAQASGRPVVTTRHGGIPEYVAADRTALVVPEADAGALAAAVVRLLRQPALARRLGEAGPAHVAWLDVRRAATRMDALYAELLGEPAPLDAGAPLVDRAAAGAAGCGGAVAMSAPPGGPGR